jgi:hypothetical protein
MAISIYPMSLINSNALRIVTDTDVDETCEGNVNDGSAALYAVYIDNTANAAISYMKFYDLDTPVTVGTTVPVMILPIAASARTIYVFPSSITFSTGLSFAAVTAAGTGGTTGPASAMLAYLVLG